MEKIGLYPVYLKEDLENILFEQDTCLLFVGQKRKILNDPIEIGKLYPYLELVSWSDEECKQEIKMCWVV